MNRNTFVAGFLASGGDRRCRLRPAPAPADGSAAAGRARARHLADYSVNGPGSSHLPWLTRADRLRLQVGGRDLPLIGPEATDAAKRYAANNLACKNCHLDAGTNRAGRTIGRRLQTYPKFSARSAG